MKQKKIVLPDGWEIDTNELPKTWEECFKQLGEAEYMDITGFVSRVDIAMFHHPRFNQRKDIPVGLGYPLIAFCQLLVCREVYRKGWNPNWKNTCQDKYAIKCKQDEIVTSMEWGINTLLSFQSEKIRDKFLENFRDLIEEAKELI